MYKISQYAEVEREFQKHFNTSFRPFYDGLMTICCKELCIDILKFDDYLIQKYNYEEPQPNGDCQSMDQFITKEFGDNAVWFINNLISQLDQTSINRL